MTSNRVIPIIHSARLDGSVRAVCPTVDGVGAKHGATYEEARDRMEEAVEDHVGRSDLTFDHIRGMHRGMHAASKRGPCGTPDPR